MTRLKWKDLWQYATPADAAEFLEFLEGRRATEAAIACATAAKSEASEKVRQFWVAVATILNPREATRRSHF